MGIKRDPIEYSNEYLAVIEEVSAIIEKTYPEFQYIFGQCHQIWNFQKQLLAERGIHWRTPTEMNPDICFD